MKKKILSLVLAICLIIPCVFMLAGCNGNAYKVAGKTLSYTDNIQFVWKEGTTDEQKAAIFEERWSGKTEEEVINSLKENLKNSQIDIIFNKDGSVVMKQTYTYEGESQTDEDTYYYSQSSDKKEIKIYREKDYTADTKYDGFIMFRDKSFYVAWGEYDAEATVNVLIELKKN